ncbi:hypothetical protein ACHAXS_009351 [Conticribra weissflogii]
MPTPSAMYDHLDPPPNNRAVAMGGDGGSAHDRGGSGRNYGAVSTSDDRSRGNYDDADDGYGLSRGAAGGGYPGPLSYYPYQRGNMAGGPGGGRQHPQQQQQQHRHQHHHRGSLDWSVGGMSAMGGMNMNTEMNRNRNRNVNMNATTNANANANANMSTNMGGGPVAGGGGMGPMDMGMGPMNMGMNMNTGMNTGMNMEGWGPAGGAGATGGGGPSHASYGYAGMGPPAHGGPRPMNHRGSMGSLSGWGPMGGGYPPSPGPETNANVPRNLDDARGGRAGRNGGGGDREEGDDDALRRSQSPRAIPDGDRGNYGAHHQAHGGPPPRGLLGHRSGGGPSDPPDRRARGPPRPTHPDDYPDEHEGIDYLAARAHAAQMLAAEESKRLEENLMRLEMRKMMMDRYPAGRPRGNPNANAHAGATSSPAPREAGRKTPNGPNGPNANVGNAHTAGDDFLMARAQTHLEGQRIAGDESSAKAGKHRRMDDGPDLPQDERHSRRGYDDRDRNAMSPDDIMYNNADQNRNQKRKHDSNSGYFSQGHNHSHNHNYHHQPPHPHLPPSSNYPQSHRMSMSMMNGPGTTMMMNPHHHHYPPMDAMPPYPHNAYPPQPLDEQHLAMRHRHVLGTAGFGNHPPHHPRDPHSHHPRSASKSGADAAATARASSQATAANAAAGAGVEEPPPREVVVKPVKELSAPRRPLSAYNIFFSEMREIILKEHEGDDGQDEDKNGDGNGSVNGNGNGNGDDANKASSSLDKKSDSLVKNEGNDDGDQGDADMKDSSPDAPKSSHKDDAEKDKIDQADTPRDDNNNNSNDDNHTQVSQKENTNNDSSTPNLSPENNMEAFTQNLMKKRLDKSAGKRLHRRTHGKVAFTTLAQTVGKRWRELPEEKKKKYRELAEMDRARYRKEKQARGKALREEAKRQRKEAAAQAAAAAASSR